MNLRENVAESSVYYTFSAQLVRVYCNSSEKRVEHFEVLVHFFLFILILTSIILYSPFSHVSPL